MNGILLYALIEGGGAVVAAPIFISVSKKMYDPASFFYQVTHEVNKAALFSRTDCFLRGKHKLVPVGFVVCSAAGWEPYGHNSDCGSTSSTLCLFRCIIALLVIGEIFYGAKIRILF